jgi:Tol biopolymer transport system component
MLPDGTNVRQVTDKKGRDQKPTWSPDGTKIGWVHGGGQFWVHDFETGRQRMVVNIPGGVDSAVVWSPDGSKLAYSKATPDGKEADIYVMKADGTNQTNLTNTPSVAEWEVTWSPDGSKLAYTGPALSTTRETDLDIYVMNSDGTNPVNLTDNMPEGMSVSYANWSPDGSKIAFISGWEDAPGRSGIYVMNSDGTNPVHITRATTPDLYGPPVWSPDGTKIAFLSCLGENEQDCDIYVTNADGTKKPVNITKRPEVYYGFGTDAGHTLDWQPLHEPTEAELEKQHEEHQANQQQQPQEGSKSRSMTVHSPDTGGPSLLLVAIALLFSGGVMFYAGLKRRM